MKIDYQNNDYDFLASFKAMNEIFPLIEAAQKNGVFAAIEENRPLTEIKGLLSEEESQGEMLLDIFAAAGLILRGKDYLVNAPVISKYLSGSSLLAPEKELCFLAERITAFCGQGKGSLGANRRLEGLKRQLRHYCPALIDGNPPYDLYLTDSMADFDAACLNDDGVVAFFGSYKGDMSLSSAIAAYRRQIEEGNSGLLCYDEVKAFCKKMGFAFTPPLTVSDGFSVVFAAKGEKLPSWLTMEPVDRTVAALKKLDFILVKVIDPKEVVTASWVKDHCRFGCSSFGDKHCPPHSPNFEATGTRLKEYQTALLIQGQPPTHCFQKLMLRSEKIAFKAGFYRAFAYWAGPCSICTECNPPAPPKKCTATRPSMESAGIDVFATVRAQGYRLETRAEKNDFVKYFGLLLLD